MACVRVCPADAVAVEGTQIRIVAGTLRGRKLTCNVNPNLRPTPQMVREALFSILGNAVPGRPFYDVFAGTGIVGLEAVSRGAKEARLIESDAKSCVARCTVRNVCDHGDFLAGGERLFQGDKGSCPALIEMPGIFTPT